ncbi:MAG: hypothetical protein QM612_11160 [Thermomonas sp.]|uniref:hypothetical protein n=1 Tax=Thermomonas sp. TaxID=1971895 RepID=UPI0039E5E25A
MTKGPQGPFFMSHIHVRHPSGGFAVKNSSPAVFHAASSIRSRGDYSQLRMLDGCSELHDKSLAAHCALLPDVGSCGKVEAIPC